MKPIYNYISYRVYLADYYAHKKSTEKGFSYRSFAADAGIKLANFLPWLIDGSRNLAESTIPQVIKALKLPEEDGEFFTILVKFEQAKNQEDREKYFGIIVSIRAEKAVHSIEEKRYDYFSDWTVVAIRELLNVVKFNPKDEEGYYKLGSMLRPRISKTEARKAVMLLKDLGFVEKCSDGTLQLTTQQVTTGDEAPGFFIRQFHRQMLTRAAESMDIFPSEVRDISSVSMSVSADGQQKVKEAIQRFRREIESIVREDSAVVDRLVQMNIQLFPLAEIPHEN